MMNLNRGSELIFNKCGNLIKSRLMILCIIDKVKCLRVIRWVMRCAWSVTIVVCSCQLCINTIKINMYMCHMLLSSSNVITWIKAFLSNRTYTKSYWLPIIWALNCMGSVTTQLKYLQKISRKKSSMNDFFTLEMSNMLNMKWWLCRVWVMISI